MHAQNLTQQADFAAATRRCPVSRCLVRLQSRWVAGFFAVLATLALATPSAYAQGYQWTNFVGTPAAFGAADGTGSAAQFNNLACVAADGSGNVYVADQDNHTIRKVTPGGVVTTLAGQAGVSGTSDGTGSAARFNHPSSVAVGGGGNIYVADQDNHTIRKVTPGGVVTTLAGQAGLPGSSDGTGGNALFSSPAGVAADGSGNVYVADTSNGTLRKVTPAGVVTTLAGQAGVSGSNDGTGSNALFYGPMGVAVDGSGNVYVADSANNTLRKVTPGGVVTTLAGLAGSTGSSDATGSNARFSYPAGVAVDGSGNVYVTDRLNHNLRKVTAGGVVSTLAGLAGVSGSSDGTGSAARFNFPAGVAVDGSGNIYVADRLNHNLRKVMTGGVVTTLAGSAGSIGSSDGTGSAARFNTLTGVATDTSGNVYVADSANHTLRKMTPAGVVTTLAGLTGVPGSSDGTGSAARFNYPAGVAVDGNGNIYVADRYNHSIRKVTPGGVVSTLAGLAGTSGSSDGTGSNARFYFPAGVAVDGSGNVYVADTSNNIIRIVSPSGIVNTLAGGSDSSSDGGGAIIVFGPPSTSRDGRGSAARFNMPSSVAVDGSGNVYVADRGNHTIRKVTSDGWVSTIAGYAGYFGSSDGWGSSARFFAPASLAVDGSGNVYIADSYNNTIRQMTSSGVVTTLGGNAGVSGWVDGLAAAARFNGPMGIAVSSSGTVFVADTSNNRISKGVVVAAAPAAVTMPAVSITGSQATLNGTINPNWSTTAVSFDYGLTTAYGAHVEATPTSVTGRDATAVSAVVTGLSLGTTYHFRVNGTNSAGTSNGDDQTFTANVYGWTNFVGSPASSGTADGTGIAAQFNLPQSVAVDSSGTVYVADSSNHTIRKVTPAGVVTTLAGQAGTSGNTDGTGSAARFNNPAGVAVDGSGNVYVADQNNHTIRKVTPGGAVTTLAGLAGVPGSTDGSGTTLFYSPAGVAVDSSGNVYVADKYNCTIRKVSPGRVASTLAGLARTSGSSDGSGSNARFSYPNSLAVDGSGNVYVADTGNHTIRLVTSDGWVSTIAGQAGFSGSKEGTGKAARFSSPAGVALDSSGSIYVSESSNHMIRKVTPAGTVINIGGTAGVNASVDGVGAAAGFNGPQGIAVSSTGTIYVADTSNNRISMGLVVAVPFSVTIPASSITCTEAMLNGTLNANGLSANVSFDYGLTTAYGTNVTGVPTSVTGSSTTAVSTPVSGLSPGTTYHFRVNGTNSGGTIYGSDQTFTTAFTPVTWRQQWFSTTGNSGTAADNADPYHTGVPNLVAFALLGPGQNPALAAASMLPQPRQSGGNFVYSFSEPAGVSNITYGAQYSTSLNPANWQPVTDTGTGTQHIFSVPISGSTQVFMRLTLTNLDP